MKVKQWGDKISKGAEAFFKYKSKMQTNFGTGYKFITEWVKSSEQQTNIANTENQKNVEEAVILRCFEE